MKEVLEKLALYKTLSRKEATQVVKDIAQGSYNNSQIASFLTVYRMRSITVEELEGFRDAMLELCVPVDMSDYDAIDVCGTGGDGKDTFNISTLASFVVAGAGVNVAKHGNQSVSSACGSSDIMAHFGYEFTNDYDTLKKQMEKAGICYLHAPLFHPAMKNVGPVRKELGVKTVFNMLGPMVNPAFPPNQLVGVFSLELARLYGYLYQQTDKNYVILHSVDGYDEVSLTGSVKLISDRGEKMLEPKDLGFQPLRQQDIQGDQTLEETAKTFMEVLENKGPEAHKNVVLANAGLGIYAARPRLSLEEALNMAKESLESGKALQSFKTLMEMSK